ncbi:hypothetical protein WJX74_009035 [Apatococcus lobatus]|uniref:TFIIS N-terminal domain-containing protein n=1 Tax=Apatococcus lobatus TaxID=904363 RepID=A0AAW1RDG6_9CHLO
MSGQQRAKLVEQRAEFLQQVESLRAAVQRQMALTKQNPLAEELASDVKPSDPPAQADAPVMPAPEPGSVPLSATPAAADAWHMPSSSALPMSPPGKPAKLTGEAEQILLTFFALQDTLSKEDVVILASQAGCEEGQVREFFTRLRNSVRSFLQRLQRRATAKAGGSQAVPATPGIPASHPSHGALTSQQGSAPAEQQAGAGGVPVPQAAHSLVTQADERRARGLQELSWLLNDAGALTEPSQAGELINRMRLETSWEVRTRQLEAILGTARPAVLLKFASSDVLNILEGWLWTGDADRQMTFLRLLLQTAARLPFPPVMLQNSHFLKAVGVLQRYRHVAVARAAAALLQQWKALDPALAIQPLKSALSRGNVASPKAQLRTSSELPQGSRASGPKPAPARASANYSGPVVVRGQQSLPRPITLQPPPRLPRPITLQPPQQRQQPQQPPQQKQQPHMQRQQPQQQRQQSSAEQTQHLPSTSGSMGPPPKKQGLSWEQRRLGPAAATPAAAAEKPSKKRPMTADEIVRAKAKARLAQQAGFFSTSGSTSGSRPSMPSRLSAGGSKPTLPPSNLLSHSGKPLPTAANPLPAAAAAAAASGQSGGQRASFPARGGLHAQKGWLGHAAATGTHPQPAASSIGSHPTASQMGTHLPGAGPTHLQQPAAAGGWGAGPGTSNPTGATGHAQAAPSNFQQQLPGLPDSAQLRKVQMATADQEYQQQERQHHGLQQAWAVQERRLQGQALADAGKMQPTLRAFVPPQRMSMRPEPAQELGWAVESSEVATQRQRESMEVEAVYVIPELIPDSPAEPWAVHDPIAHVAPALVMPFCPAEKEEAQWQDDALWKAGVRLSSFFADPTASAVSLAPSTQSSGSSNPGGLLWSSGQAQPLLMGEPTQQALQWPFMMQPASYVHQPSYRPPS